jgi:hypothetical protein
VFVLAKSIKYMQEVEIKNRDEKHLIPEIINSSFGSKNGSRNGSKLATLLGVMCFAQDDSI